MKRIWRQERAPPSGIGARSDIETDTEPFGGARGLLTGGWLPYALLPFYVLAHAAAVLVVPGHAAPISFAFMTAPPLLAAVACGLRGRAAASPYGWAASTIAMLLWAGGMAVTAVNTLALNNASGVNAVSMVLFVLYGVPLLFAVASPGRERWPARIVDAVLALTLGWLFFAHSFAFATLSGTDEAGLISLALMFDIENLFIAIFALVRFAASPDPEGRSLFGTMAAFAFLYLLTAGYINHFEGDSDYGGVIDAVIGVPFLALAAMAVGGGSGLRALAVPTRVIHVVRAASPLILPVTLLVVSALLIRDHPALAITGFVLATLGTGLRNILVQTRNLAESQHLEQLARIDALTGLPNRRQFDETLRREWSRALQSGQPLAVLMIDIDHFKQLNDRLGHPVGDERLRSVGRALAASLESGKGLVARYGGEEFAAVLAATTPVAAARAAETIRASVAALRLTSPAAAGIVTVSVGIGCIETAERLGADDLLRTADAALYDAKARGRNCVAQRFLGTAAPRHRR